MRSRWPLVAALLVASCGGAKPNPDGGTDTAADAGQMACGQPTTPDRPCCPSDWTLGSTCRPPATGDGTCWSACKGGLVVDGGVQPVRSVYFCGQDQKVGTGLGLFPCTP
jgi:hypothetical protein